MSSARIPVLVVSGFLGSGKTTLVRHLLGRAQESGQRVAVVSNELGELGIDAALLGQGARDYIELEGGCVCCQLADDLVESLEQLHRAVSPDRVIIETSGVALPWDVQLNLYRPPIDAWVGDDLTCVVVNAEQVAAGRELEGTFADQLAGADLVLLNKLDLVGSASAQALEATLREFEPEAPILRSVHGRVDERLLFPPEPETGGEPAAARRERDLESSARPHTHDDFEARELRFDDVLSEDELAARLRALGALRVKGFVRTARGPKLVQGVGPRVELVDPDAAPPAELIGRVVVISRAPGPGRRHEPARG